MELKLLSFFSSIFLKNISLLLKLYFSPTFIFVIISDDKILLNRIASMNKLNPKCAITWETLINFFKNSSFRVVKNKKKAAEIKIV